MIKVAMSADGVKMEVEEVAELKSRRGRPKKIEAKGKSPHLDRKSTVQEEETKLRRLAMEEEGVKCRGRWKQGRRLVMQKGEEGQRSTCDSVAKGKPKQGTLCGRKRWALPLNVWRSIL